MYIKRKEVDPTYAWRRFRALPYAHQVSSLGKKRETKIQKTMPAGSVLSTTAPHPPSVLQKACTRASMQSLTIGSPHKFWLSTRSLHPAQSRPLQRFHVLGPSESEDGATGTRREETTVTKVIAHHPRNKCLGRGGINNLESKGLYTTQGSRGFSPLRPIFLAIQNPGLAFFFGLILNQTFERRFFSRNN